MPQLPQPAAARPLLSVVFPLLDERGLALACIRGWVEVREVPLQIVLVSDGRRPTLERSRCLAAALFRTELTPVPAAAAASAAFSRAGRRQGLPAGRHRSA